MLLLTDSGDFRYIVNDFPPLPNFSFPPLPDFKNVPPVVDIDMAEIMGPSEAMCAEPAFPALPYLEAEISSFPPLPDFDAEISSFPPIPYVEAEISSFYPLPDLSNFPSFPSFPIDPLVTEPDITQHQFPQFPNFDTSPLTVTECQPTEVDREAREFPPFPEIVTATQQHPVVPPFPEVTDREFPPFPDMGVDPALGSTFPSFPSFDSVPPPKIRKEKLVVKRHRRLGDLHEVPAKFLKVGLDNAISKTEINGFSQRSVNY